MAGEFDLFGNPVRAGKGARGRPAFERTERDANKVKLLLARGWPNQRIAHAVGCSVPSLKRHFRSELRERDAMRDRLEARHLELLMEAANGGNVGAMKQIGAMLDRDAIRTQARRARLDDEPETEAPEPRRVLGKKESAVEAARQLVQEDTLLNPERLN